MSLEAPMTAGHPPNSAETARGEINGAVSVMGQPTMLLADLLANYRPGSFDPPWSWDDEERTLHERICLCCGQPGHYQQQLEAHLAEHGLTQGVCLGTDGRVWDGHHRIVAARRLGIEVIPLESSDDAGERWLRDHGPTDWHGRTKGDCADVADYKRHWRVSHSVRTAAPASTDEGVPTDGSGGA